MSPLLVRKPHAEAVQVLPKLHADLGMIEREVKPRLEISEPAAAVVARSFQHVREGVLFLQQRRDGVGQLDFAALSCLHSLQVMEDARGQDIASNYAQG